MSFLTLQKQRNGWSARGGAWLRVALLVAATCPARAAVPAAHPRAAEPLDFAWRFAQRDVANGQDVGLDDADWPDVDLPHDWSIEGEYRQDSPAGGAGARPALQRASNRRRRRAVQRAAEPRRVPTIHFAASEALRSSLSPFACLDAGNRTQPASNAIKLWNLVSSERPRG